MEKDKELSRIYKYMQEKLGNSFAEKQISLINAVKDEMTNQICHFAFKKVNGEIRECYGTRAQDIISSYASQEKAKPKEEKANGYHIGTFPYFDLEKLDWRCFKVENLLQIDNEYAI